MELRIEYIEKSVGGRIAVSSDFPTYAWSRIKALAVSVQPDSAILRSSLDCDWTTVLAIAADLSRLRSEYGFSVSYEEKALSLLRNYQQECQKVRDTSDASTLLLSSEQLIDKLKQQGFTKRELKSYQLRDLARQLALANGANFSVPGAGKTTVAFAAYLLARTADTKLMVVAPKNAFSAWDEVVVDCLDPSVDSAGFTRLVGGRDNIKSLLQARPLRSIISYDQLIRCRALVAAFLQSNRTHVILDESHRMKAGERSMRGSALLRLAPLPVRRDILSGTPIPRSIDDIVSQFDFLWPGQRLGAKIATAESPGTVLSGLYVRTTKQELGLPKPIKHFVPINMSQPQLALYGLLRSEILKKFAGIRSDANIDIRSARRSVMRLMQASSNPIMVVRRLTMEAPDSYPYDDPSLEGIFLAINEEPDSPKIKYACQLARDLSDKGLKCVIWSSFTANVERIAELLSDIGATYIHGGVDTGDNDDTREARIKAFHEQDQCRVLVANPAACSEGISLHKVCHHAIYVDRTYNAAHYLQSVDRIHRLGLAPGIDTHIHVLESIALNATGGAIDFSIRRRLISKLKVMASVLNDDDLHRLALDEEEEDEPIDYGISIKDIADIIDELSGNAEMPGEEEL